MIGPLWYPWIVGIGLSCMDDYVIIVGGGEDMEDVKTGDSPLDKTPPCGCLLYTSDAADE